MGQKVKEIIADNLTESTPVMETMRASLKPKGTEPIVRLSITNPYFDHDFVRGCLDEMEMKLALAGTMLEPPTHLERLAIIVLKDSSDCA